MPSRLVRALGSPVGTKLLIGLTGLFLFVFLITHLAGNLLFLLGPEKFNEYSHALISNPLIYVAEIGLLAIFAVHVFKTIANFLANQAARPQRYATHRWVKTKSDRSRKSLASSSMIISGLVTLLFVVTHLATFKFGTYYETSTGIRDLYRLQLEVFSNPLYVVFYLVCMGVIFLHLWHGVSSAAQSLGLENRVWMARVWATGQVLAVAIAGGFFILPLYTFFVARAS
jgi:succinate dehydrogenase / fumarate reductase cytochrome b subunit